MPRKVIQLAAVEEWAGTSGRSIIAALCDDGTMWRLEEATPYEMQNEKYIWKWKQYPDVPPA